MSLILLHYDWSGGCDLFCSLIGQVVLGVSSLVGSEPPVWGGVKESSQSRSNQWKTRDNRQVNTGGNLSVCHISKDVSYPIRSWNQNNVTCRFCILTWRRRLSQVVRHSQHTTCWGREGWDVSPSVWLPSGQKIHLLTFTLPVFTHLLIYCLTFIHIFTLIYVCICLSIQPEQMRFNP